MSALLDVEKARSQFPALKDGYIFADNAGGSQCLKDVADKVYDYLLFTNVQLGTFQHSTVKFGVIIIMLQGPITVSQ